MEEQPSPPTSQPISFKAETQQLLRILIHSLYTEREIFLRELISNASDALTRADFEILTNRNILDPEAELSIRITVNPEENLLTITDTGIGMTADELAENLGTIAHSGARAFIEAARENKSNLADMIGQFGVGFYSAFMVAEWIRVTSRSYRPEAQAASWFSTGSDTFTIEPVEKAERGTTVTLKLKEDSSEYAKEYRLREIIRKHSDFVPYPIYLGQEVQQVNRQTALWRQTPRQVTQQEYEDFYKQFSLDFEPPLAHAHMVVDAPVQMYAVLFIPTNAERNLLSTRREDGIKLYSRKVLIQEYNKDLLPEYLRFVQGVVDSEDLPLNVSRESVQASKIMANLKKLVTSKVLDTLKLLSQEDADKYKRFWESYGRALKQGVAMEPGDRDNLLPLLRFHTSAHSDEWSSLDDYLQRLKPEQNDIYYVMGEDDRSIQYSPHLDLVRQAGFEVLLLTDPLDPFMLTHLEQYKEHKLVNLASQDLDLPKVEGSDTPPTDAEMQEGEFAGLIERFRIHLGDRVVDVRPTNRLSDAPARLVDPQGAPNQELQRVYRLIDKDYQTPRKILEVNPHHPILERLARLPADDALASLIVDQVYENSLLIEGLHPDPAGMIGRIQRLMVAALE